MAPKKKLDARKKWFKSQRGVVQPSLSELSSSSQMLSSLRSKAHGPKIISTKNIPI
jgi:hypothetical protein